MTTFSKVRSAKTKFLHLMVFCISAEEEEVKKFSQQQGEKKHKRRIRHIFANAHNGDKNNQNKSKMGFDNVWGSHPKENSKGGRNWYV
jgi:hypothetical protein